MRIYNQDSRNFVSFLRRTTQKRRTLEHILQMLPIITPQTAARIREGKDIRVLDIGSGSGAEYLPLLDKLSGQGSRVFTDMDEPSIGMNSKFIFNYILKPFDFNRLSIVDTYRQYDLAFASHVMYYIDDWENKITEIYDSLSPGGAACIPMTSSQGSLYSFRQKHFPLIHCTKPKCAEDLMQTISKLGIPFTTSSVSSHLSIAEKLKQDVGKEFGLDSLVSFMLRTDYNSLDPDLQKEISKDVEALSKDGAITLTDKVIWFKKPGRSGYQEQPCKNSPFVKLKDYVGFLQSSIEKSIGPDVDFLPDEVKQAYFKTLALDSFLSHPQFQALPLFYGNGQQTEDEFLMYNYPGHKATDDIILFSPRDPLIFTRRFPNYNWHGHAQYLVLTDNIPYLQGFIVKQHEEMPEDLRQQMIPGELYRLILDMYHHFKHDIAFSMNNRTCLGLYARSEFIDMIKLTIPKKDTALVKQINGEMRARTRHYQQNPKAT